MGGFVYLSPDGRTAVKVHRYEEGFLTEVEAYSRLRRVRTSQLHGIVIPKVHDERFDIKVIRMDFVTPPFLVDFAGVKFHPPDFSDDALADWNARLSSMFGPNIGLVWAVYSALAQHGIWYTDLHPRNLWLEGHPDFQPMPPRIQTNTDSFSAVSKLTHCPVLNAARRRWELQIENCRIGIGLRRARRLPAPWPRRSLPRCGPGAPVPSRSGGWRRGALRLSVADRLRPRLR